MDRVASIGGHILLAMSFKNGAWNRKKYGSVSCLWMPVSMLVYSVVLFLKLRKSAMSYIFTNQSAGVFYVFMQIPQLLQGV